MSRDDARRTVLRAQGFGGPPVSPRTALRRLGAVQIDTISTVHRTHHLVVGSRTGAIDEAGWDRLIYRRRAGFEYWGHGASFLPIELWPLRLPHMRRFREAPHPRTLAYRARNARVYSDVLARLDGEGPLTAGDLTEPETRQKRTWWDRSVAKEVLEDLFNQGILTVHDRIGFTRRYDRVSRVFPALVDVPVPGEHEAAVELVVHAAERLGVGSAHDLADYFRVPLQAAKPAIGEAVGDGRLVAMTVEGWDKPAYLAPGTVVPRAVGHEPELISPFDSLIWAQSPHARERTKRIFGFDYLLEIYVPPTRRKFGYYTMPVLAGTRLVALVDPTYDRAARVLTLRSVHPEPHEDVDFVRASVATGSIRLGRLLGADSVSIRWAAGDVAVLLI